MATESSSFNFSELMERILTRNKGCNEIWNRISPYKRGGHFETQGVTKLDFSTNTLNFTFATQKTPFTSLSGYFLQVGATNSNKFKEELPDLDYNITEKMLDQYSLFNPTSPKVLGILQEWLRAIEDCYVYLSSLERDLVDIKDLEEKVMAIFKLEGKEDSHVKSATFRPIVLGCGKMKIAFKVQKVSLATMEEIDGFAKTIFPYYKLDKVVYSSDDNLHRTWAIAKSRLTLSEDQKTVTKTGYSGSVNCLALGSEGWKSGTHSWKLRVDGSISGGTTKDKLSLVVLGVATETIKQNQNDGYYIEGQTFGHCTDGEGTYYSMDCVSGSNVPTPPNTIVTLTLDCGAGTLAFSQEGWEFLKINVPKNTTLYPWVHLHTMNNSVTITN